VSFAKLGLSNADARKAWAERKAAALSVELQARGLGHIEPEDADVGDLIEGTLSLLERELRPATVVTYRRALDDFLAWTVERGVRRSRSLCASDLAHFRDWILKSRCRLVPVVGKNIGRGKYRPGKQPITTGGINVILRSVRAILSRLADRGALLFTPDDVRKKLPLVRVDCPEKRVLDSDSVRKVLTAAIDDPDPDAAPFTAGLLLGGFRFSELATLDSSSLNPETAAVRLASSATKGRQPRVIDLHVAPTLGKILGRSKNGPVFPGFTRDRAKKLLGRLKRRAKLRFNWQALRRTCGSFMACAHFGGVYVAAARLGHGFQVAEKHYLRRVAVPPDAKSLEEAMDAVDLFEQIADHAEIGGKVVHLEVAG